jgi:hypothetical protein
MGQPTGPSNRPYLPPRRTRLRAIFNPLVVIWVVLIVVFLAIWHFLNDGSNSATGPHASSGTDSPLLTLMPVAFFVVFLGYFLFMRRRATRFNAENIEALKLFAAADYAGAAARFAELTRKYRSPANLPAVAEYNEALAIMRGGALEEALARLTALDRRITRSVLGLRPLVASQLAVIHALRGEPALSDQWIVETTARLTLSGNPRVIEGTLALARLINDIRRDERAAAVRALDANWATLESTMVATELRPFRALRAFAVAGGGIPAQNPEAPGACTGFADARPGELDWLGVAWPEMQEFLGASATRR